MLGLLLHYSRFETGIVAGVDCSSMSSIYHLVPDSALRSCITAAVYRPASLATEGFVHCSATPDSVLAVARDYFPSLEGRLMVMRIDPSRLRAKLVFEAPAPTPGAGLSHLATAEQFPHIYGPIELEAVSGIGALERSGGGYRWPTEFMPFVL